MQPIQFINTFLLEGIFMSPYMPLHFKSIAFLAAYHNVVYSPNAVIFHFLSASYILQQLSFVLLPPVIEKVFYFDKLNVLNKKKFMLTS